MDIRRPETQFQCCPSLLSKETCFEKILVIDQAKAKEARNKNDQQEENDHISSLFEINHQTERSSSTSTNKLQRHRCRGPLFRSAEDENIKIGINKYGFGWAKMLNDSDLQFNPCHVRNT